MEKTHEQDARMEVCLTVHNCVKRIRQAAARWETSPHDRQVLNLLATQLGAGLEALDARAVLE